MATNNAINSIIGSKITKFTASGTWTKNVNTQSVEVIVWNSGAGGGSGRQGATTSSGGGAGGSAAGIVTWYGPALFLGSTESVTVASGGSGGLTQSSNLNNGNPGGASGQSSLGNILITPSLAQAGGGITGTATTSTVSGAFFWNYSSVGILATPAGGNGGVSTGSTAQNNYNGANQNTVYSQALPCGGGGGSGADAVTARQAGNGGTVNYLSYVANGTLVPIYTGGAGGIETGTINGGNGTDATNTSGGIFYGGSGAGGGGGQKSGGSAGTGGNGGIPGGGGGGGGGSLSGTTSGAGGNGGRGEVWVIEYF